MSAASLCVLLVEPDRAQAAAIAGWLQPRHINVVTADSAQGAIAAADAAVPNVVVLELALPAHNGIEFLHEFRSYPEWEHIPVIIFSQQYIEDLQPFTALGNISYLYKPNTSLSRLYEVIQGVLA